MSAKKIYACGICGTIPCQISHHKSHLKTQKHINKKKYLKCNYSSN